MPAGAVFYTDWSALNHRAPSGPTATSFADALVSNDASLHHDLGIRSTDAQWEVDVERPDRPPLVLQGFDAHVDLSGLAGKLTRFGYRADGSVFSGKLNPDRMWTVGLSKIGIDRGRHLLVGGADVTTSGRFSPAWRVRSRAMTRCSPCCSLLRPSFGRSAQRTFRSDQRPA
jgi:hypothetical protein